jgi:hypothetical protein
MTQEQIAAELSRKPFVPFRLRLRTGEELDVPFSHVILFQRGSLILFNGVEAEGVQVAKGYRHVPDDAVDHIVSPPPATRQNRAS